jgi:hypothetical protein
MTIFVLMDRMTLRRSADLRKQESPVGQVGSDAFFS